jgi:biotin-dependent carboxylase-like uncharacterized protein
MIEVLRAGTLSSVQDLGRAGYRHLGICRSGALDTLALTVANQLVGNANHAAGLEITLGPVALRFPRATRIALAGADFAATLDDVPVHAWWSVTVAAGQTLTLRAAKRGMRAYLAVAGGIDVLPMLGSRSTDLTAGFGGLGGRALKDGDRLPVGGPGAAAGPAFKPGMPAFGVKSPAWCRFARLEPGARHVANHVAGQPLVMRVLPGPEYGSFSGAALDALWSQDWQVTPHSNRMGYRLSGPALKRKKNGELLSHGVVPGTIQVPPNGQPIVLMGDAQTAGGYPKIGAVISADLWRLAQARLNSHLCFVECTPAEARAALVELETYLKQIDIALALQHERIAHCFPTSSERSHAS